MDIFNEETLEMAVNAGYYGPHAQGRMKFCFFYCVCVFTVLKFREERRGDFYEETLEMAVNAGYYGLHAHGRI